MLHKVSMGREKQKNLRKKSDASIFSIVIAYAVLFVFFCITSEHFLSSSNMLSVLKSTVTNGLLAFGITYCLIIGKIDLSVGSIFSFSGVLVALLISRFGVPFWPALLITALMSIVIGFVNGYVTANTAIPPFIVTLAMQNVIRGVAYVICGSMPVNCRDETFANFANRKWFGYLTNQVVIMLIVCIILAILLRRTVFGRHMYATGGNYATARYSGINVQRVTIIVYIICAFTAMLSGVLSAARIQQGQPSSGLGYEGDAIAAAVLGGTSFNGGKGTIIGTFVGALILSTLQNGLYMLGVNYYVQMVITGVLTLLVVYFDMAKANKE